MIPPPHEIHATLAVLARDTLDRSLPAPSADLSEQLDSVERLSLVVAIEDHYELCFDPEDEEAVTTLDDVVRVIQQKLSHG